MSSLRDVYESKKPTLVVRCKVCVWLGEQSPEDQAFFTENVGKNMAFMARVCRDELGLDAEVTAVRNHVRNRHTLQSDDVKR